MSLIMGVAEKAQATVAQCSGRRCEGKTHIRDERSDSRGNDAVLIKADVGERRLLSQARSPPTRVQSRASSLAGPWRKATDIVADTPWPVRCTANN